MNNFYFKNKGMYLEDLINKTCDYYIQNKIAFISKRFLPIKITNRKNNKINGILLDKSTVDYNGLYNGLFFDFEAKQTNNNYFLLSNIKKHQLDHLILINDLKGISFIILCFMSDDNFFIIPIDYLIKLINSKIKSIDLDFCNKNLFKLKIIFPGILNIIDFINNI